MSYSRGFNERFFWVDFWFYTAIFMGVAGINDRSKLEHIAYGSKIVTKGLQSGIGGIGKNKNSLETTLRSGAFSI
ncbi:uncharacterized protein LOC105420717 isoform X3 [Amborella trichopoda]|uniref:uncharacterized protein LOC105420717 isoform X3 n=1 Tax=Amborella trichopoda TaxID=13333 RepID=UPI0009BF8D24|nr:uncharacterized protein LOC105420717 isoform X3 [Amborella trichopoda]|eukprot:XP_020523353.1 uncharacterized protein LOC105420717 isoform X3 [Amborella trichopoda]